MQTVTLEQAREQFEDLIQKAAHGEAFQITKNGRPIVEVASVPNPHPWHPPFPVDCERDERGVPTQAEFDKLKASITPEQSAATLQELRAKGRVGGLEGKGFVVPPDFKAFMREEIEDMFYEDQE